MIQQPQPQFERTGSSTVREGMTGQSVGESADVLTDAVNIAVASQLLSSNSKPDPSVQ